MEAVDTARLCLSVYPALAAAAHTGAPLAPGHTAPPDAPWSERHTANVVATVAAGYPFPANLDLAPPGSAAGKETEAALLASALKQHWTLTEMRRRLVANRAVRVPPPLPRLGFAAPRFVAESAQRLACSVVAHGNGVATWLLALAQHSRIHAAAVALLSGVLALRLRA